MVEHSGQSHYRLFVLGAGFSKPAGLPLAVELLEDVRREVRRYFREHGGGEGTFEQEIEEWAMLYPGQLIDLERVLAYSHRKHYLRLLGSKEYFEHGSRTIVAARKSIQRILIDRTPADPPSLYKKFSSQLSPNDVVLTFNYDTLLEQSLDAVGSSYSLTPEWWLDSQTSFPGYKHVDLLKLHGSIDWYDRRYHDDAARWHFEEGHYVPDRDPIFGPRPSVQTEPLCKSEASELGQNILSNIFRVLNHSEHFPLDGKRFSHVVPFLLPLAYDKLLGHEPILDLWRSLHHNHGVFSSIIVIGYSMPRSDGYAYEALGKLFLDYQASGEKTRWEQRRVPVQVITLADSKENALESLPFLDADLTHVWHEGFSDKALDWLDWGDGNLRK